jgi:hypothetical protein
LLLRKARDEKGQKGQTNFDDNGVEIPNTSYNPEGGQDESSVYVSNVDVPDTSHLSKYECKEIIIIDNYHIYMHK